MGFFAVSTVVLLALMGVGPWYFTKAILEPGLDGESETIETKHNNLHREKDCDRTSKITLNEGYEKFLRAYEFALRESNMFLNSNERKRELMIEEISNIRAILYDPEDHLQAEEDKEIVDWVKELDSLTEDQVKQIMRSLVSGRLYFTFMPVQRAYQM